MKDYNDILTLIDSSDFFSWTRGERVGDPAILEVYKDSPGLRVIHSFTIRTDVSGQVLTYHEFDAKAKAWGKPAMPREIPTITSVKGRQKLFSFIQRVALKDCGYPNPMYFVHFR
jgi:hypothetical protein